MSLKKSSKDVEVPFYALPTKRKSSAEIIRQAKDEIQVMAGRRPSTPFVKNNQRCRSQTSNSRPSSSISQLSFSPEPPPSRPLSGIRLKPLRKEGSITKESLASLHLEPTVMKTPLICKRTQSKITQTADSFVSSGSDVLRESTDIARDSTTSISSRRQNIRSVNTRSSDLIHQNSNAENKENEQGDHWMKHKLSIDKAIIGLEVCDHADGGEEGSSKSERFSEEVRKYFPVLEKLIREGKARDEMWGFEITTKVYKLFEKSEMFRTPFDGRLFLLKLLFRLLDSHFPVLSLHISKLVLEMKIADKNLANVYRLLYKLCHEEKNIVEFLSGGILGPFFDCLQDVSVQNNAEALKYGTSLLCILAANDLLLDILGVFQCHEILLKHLTEVNNLEISGKNAELQLFEIVIKIVTAVRYLAEDEVIYQAIISNSTTEQLTKAIDKCRDNVEVVIPSIRLLSKIVDTDDGCQVATMCDNICDVLVQVLKSYKCHLFISVQVTFIIGNLISNFNSLALTFYLTPGFIDVLISLLNNFMQNQIERAKQMTSFSRNSLYNTEDCVGDKDDIEVMIKVIRIFANMCLNPDVGCHLAENGKCIVTLLKLIEGYKIEDPDEESIYEPLTSILITMNNITYFMCEDYEVTSLCMKIAEAVIPLLNSSYFKEVRIEACNVVRNITRISEIRSFLLSNKLVPAFVSLLDECDNEIVVGGYALIMNLLLDKRAREPFYKQQGVTKLLHKFHISLSRDWKTAAFLCQVLWNYCRDENFNKPLTHLEIQHLIKVLQYSTGPNAILKTDPESTKHIWEHEFCGVATDLLNLLQSFI